MHGTLEPPALEIGGLSFSYSGKPVLDGIGFSIARGEFVVLLGPNGAGKTTLFSLVTRLYDRRVGTIRIDGHDVRSEPRRALARLGVVFQQPTLDLDLTVRQNLAYHAALHGMPAASRAPASRSSSTASAWPTACATASARSRAASAAGSRSPAP
jgi:ABC-2 type transport system ATP-binding protein